MIKKKKYDKIEILKRSEIALLDDLDKKELIQIIQKLEKENNELKEKLYGKIEEKEVETEAKAISNEEINEQRMSLLNTIDVPELKDTIDSLKQNKKAAYQENIIDLYLNDLKTV